MGDRAGRDLELLRLQRVDDAVIDRPRARKRSWSTVTWTSRVMPERMLVVPTPGTRVELLLDDVLGEVLQFGQ